jgi:hypothetical protein
MIKRFGALLVLSVISILLSFQLSISSPSDPISSPSDPISSPSDPISSPSDHISSPRSLGGSLSSPRSLGGVPLVSQ